MASMNATGLPGEAVAAKEDRGSSADRSAGVLMTEADGLAPVVAGAVGLVASGMSWVGASGRPRTAMTFWAPALLAPPSLTTKLTVRLAVAGSSELSA